MIPEGGAQMADDFFSEIGRSLSRFTQQAVGKTGEVVEMTPVSRRKLKSFIRKSENLSTEA